MTALVVATAVALVRAWTDAYTRQLPAQIGDARRQEIESDLWEFLRDRASAGSFGTAAHIAARLVLGVPDDLQFRFEHREMVRHPARTSAAIAATALVLVLGGMWGITATQSDDLPPLPEPPRRISFVVAAPPPPPPPPPAPALWPSPPGTIDPAQQPRVR
jgi:hypothetical protein